MFVLFIAIVILFAIVIPKSFAASTPVEYITFSSKNLNYEKKEDGSWNLVKSVKWIGRGRARITFNINTNQMLKDNVHRDVILVVDNSSSMVGEKLNKVKSDSVDLVNRLLEDSNNRLGLISFSGSSTILSGLTNNSSELISKINDLTANGNTNYYQALVKVDEMLKSYKKENNRECVVLFLTDGYPNINTPNEIAQYQYLKKEYSYLNIN
ncbi:MAG TPA: VWA domain-containing protein, partial [Candidatus Faecimonas gallistercoris]|nr:VWA domain-containing protein [Candidatus Faecimonas gallistercoris]